MNIIITSDHGMYGIQNNKIIYLEKYLNLDLFDAYGGIVSKNLFLKKKDYMNLVYEKLKNITSLNVYKKSEFPEEYHYKKNIRFGDILIVAKLGFVIFEKHDDFLNDSLSKIDK